MGTAIVEHDYRPIDFEHLKLNVISQRSFILW